MRSPHFLKVKSRIGLVNPPIHHTELNIGVENGGDAILTQGFLAQFGNPAVSEFVFPKPEEVKKEDFDSVLAQSLRDCARFIRNSVPTHSAQIVIGGDHSITFPSVLAVLERVGNPQEIGYLQIDSHGDINLQAESPTDNFHGMYARALVDRFDVPEIDALVPQKLPTENVMYVGNLDLDPGEQEFFKTHSIACIGGTELSKNTASALESIRDFISSFSHLHITLDIDVLDKIEAPATGIPADNGLRLNDVLKVLQTVAVHPSISFDLAEVNPKKEGAKQTIAAAQKILSMVLR